MNNKLKLDTILYNGKEDAVTIEKLLEYLNEAKSSQKELAEFVCKRLNERYIEPFKGKESTPEETKWGFSTMASMCLLIETIQSFKYGYDDTMGISREMFNEFWEDDKVKDLFKIGDKITKKFLTDKKTSFYTNVRCGILHQGETKGGWIINSKKTEEVIEKNETEIIINAQKFVDKMEKLLGKYHEELKKPENINTSLWNNCLLKLHSIIKNCEPIQ